MNNYMAIKWITWKKWKIPRNVQSSKIEPGKNRNYEQPKYKHWNWSYDQTSPQKQKLRIRWLHRRILSNIFLLKENCFTEFCCFLSNLNMNQPSVQFSRWVMSDSLQPHESQHARPPCPSPTPGVYSNSCPSSQWCHPAISSSVVPYSFCPQPLPASGSFPRVNSSHEVAKVLEFQLQHQSFQWIPRTDLL